ncbi:MFS transporter [Streptomyces sparsogenes]
MAALVRLDAEVEFSPFPGFEATAPKRVSLAPELALPSVTGSDTGSHLRVWRHSMPLAAYILGLGIFTQGTSEFMLFGLLPDLADALDASTPDAGLLISAFAIGMVVGAPLLAVATLKWPRRTALVALQAVFIAAHIVGALAPGYGVLFVTRVISALAYAGFWGVAVLTLVSLVCSVFAIPGGPGGPRRRRVPSAPNCGRWPARSCGSRTR